MIKRKEILPLAAAALLLCLMSGCGKVNTKSPEAVVGSLLDSYQEQSEENALKCMGLDPKKEPDQAIKDELDYNMKLFKAHHAKAVRMKKADVIGEVKEKSLVYTWFTYEIKQKEKTIYAPSLSFYFVKKEDKQYYVVPARDVTDEMSAYSREEYQEFLSTEVYKDYQKSYREFTRENPKYEATLESSFFELTNEN